MLSIREIAGLLNAAYSFARAEKWDKIGLLVGDANADANRVLVAHEITDATIDEAIKLNCSCVVVYHPPIFRALENLDFQNHSVRLAARCIRANIAVVAVHTALDNAPFGLALGDKLASQIGLTNVRVLDASGSETWFKLVVYVPDGDLENVQNALWDAGAGQIGNYDNASFRARGIGTFRALDGANPTIGTLGETEIVGEWRLEVLIPQSKIERCVRAMKTAHSYEEIAYDMIKLENQSGANYGAARIGELSEAEALHVFSRDVCHRLRAPSARTVSSQKERVQIVACVPGSGASYIESAVKNNCDVLVSGDFKHHDALQAQAHNLSLIDATHVATERAAIEMIAEVLQSSTRFETLRSTINTNPFGGL